MAAVARTPAEALAQAVELAHKMSNSKSCQLRLLSIRLMR